MEKAKIETLLYKLHLQNFIRDFYVLRYSWEFLTLQKLKKVNIKPIFYIPS